MKIALLGSREIALSVAWGISHAELVDKVVIFSDSQMGGRPVNRNYRNSNTYDGVKDITLAAALSNSDTDITCTNSTESLSNSDIVLLLPADPPLGFRSDQSLRKTNFSIVQQVMPKIFEHIKDAKILVAMPSVNYISAWIHQTFGSNNVLGISNGIATAQLKSEIAHRVGISVKDISALAIGTDDRTYPLPQYCRVNGIPLVQLLDESKVQEIVNTVSESYPRSIDSVYTLTSHILEIISTITLDKKRVISVGTLISSDKTSVFLNVPSKIGSNGIENIVPLELTDIQREQFTQLVAQCTLAQTF